MPNCAMLVVYIRLWALSDMNTAIIYLDFGVLEPHLWKMNFKTFVLKRSLRNFCGYYRVVIEKQYLSGLQISMSSLREGSDARRILIQDEDPPIICDQLSITLIFCHDLLGNSDPAI